LLNPDDKKNIVLNKKKGIIKITAKKKVAQTSTLISSHGDRKIKDRSTSKE
jgi:hypothetical protein